MDCGESRVDADAAEGVGGRGEEMGRDSVGGEALMSGSGIVGGPGTGVFFSVAS